MNPVLKFFSLFQRKAKPMPFGELQVKFYLDAVYFPQVGQIEVSSASHKLSHSVVRFAFPGISRTPPMTLELMGKIWKEAMIQGFFPHHIVSYGFGEEVVAHPSTGRLTVGISMASADTLKPVQDQVDVPAVIRNPIPPALESHALLEILNGQRHHNLPVVRPPEPTKLDVMHAASGASRKTLSH